MECLIRPHLTMWFLVKTKNLGFVLYINLLISNFTFKRYDLFELRLTFMLLIIFFKWIKLTEETLYSKYIKFVRWWNTINPVSNIYIWGTSSRLVEVFTIQMVIHVICCNTKFNAHCNPFLRETLIRRLSCSFIVDIYLFIKCCIL